MTKQLGSNFDWAHALTDNLWINDLEVKVLPSYLGTCRWYAGKAKTLIRLNIEKYIPMAIGDDTAYLCIIKTEFDDGQFDHYFLPLSFINLADNQQAEIHTKGIITVCYIQNKRGILIDALYQEAFQQVVFHNLAHNITLKASTDEIRCQRGRGLAGEDIGVELRSRVLMVEQSNSSLIYGEKYFLKLYRKLFDQVNPEVEMVSFLTDHSNFAYIPAYAGSINWFNPNQPLVTLAIMQRMVDNQNDSWTVTGTMLEGFAKGFESKIFSIEESFFEKVELLAKRTAEMHLALFAPKASSDFLPENFDHNYCSFLYKRITHLLESRYAVVIEKYTCLPAEAQKLAWDFMEAKELIDEFIAELMHKELHSQRIRVHGDYHLGQVLATETDYIIIDFEGEPESSITDRKIKHSPLKDVAGMIRSYHYAISSCFFSLQNTQENTAERKAKAADRWYDLIQQTFLQKYFSTFGYPHPLFKNNNETNFLLLLYLLEKAVYELGYEINYRPEWVKIPLKGIVDVIREIEKLKM